MKKRTIKTDDVSGGGTHEVTRATPDNNKMMTGCVCEPQGAQGGVRR